ncbi:hypothetical protein SETIT_2G038500v2 [Setaria italica]|uniref:BURP domain-containing protein n=1 Tax=Setaria italica TaxID=4555 RepID=A0A368PUT3_SETIT|nr:hypothetical protein SETIT_2G038500v2 [Setaria italica]
MKWDMRQPSHATDTSSFKQEAYPSQQHSGPSALGSSFFVKPTRPPYPVEWTAPVLAASDVAEKPARVHGMHVEPGMLLLRRSLSPGAILPEGTRFAGDAVAPAPPRFVSSAAADAIPVGYKQLDTILGMFRIPRGSRTADQVAATLRTCEEPSSEPHTCTTSQQAAAAFTAGALGTSAPRAVVTIVHGEEAAGARYTVALDGVARIGGGGGGKAVVPCHPRCPTRTWSTTATGRPA